MQTLFDLPMSSSLSYVVAIVVILGLLAIFAVIVRRVAAQGLNPDGTRGRGPRLGVVDTYSLDRTRQLVIVRRDNVEHLLMIGGSNDILVESNIVRAVSASSIRESQPQFASSQASFGLPYDGPSGRPLDDDEPFNVPQPQPPYAAAPVAPSQPAPRLKMSPAAPTTPSAATMSSTTASYQPRLAVEPPMGEPAPAAQPAAAASQRDALNTAELQALARRLEASIPPLSTKPDKAPQQSAPLMPSAAPMPTMPQMPAAAPIPAAPPVPSSPMATMAPAPQAAPAPAPFAASPSDYRPNPPPQMPPAQIMTQPPPPMPSAPPQPTMPAMVSIGSPQPSVMPQAAAPQPRPALSQPPMPSAAPFQPHISPPQPSAPQPPAPMEPQGDPAKDRQAAALDENLRRLLGRKTDPR